MHYPKVSVLVLNWNGLNDTIECLNSVKKIEYPNFDTIVVDNGSTDQSVQIIREKFPHVLMITNKINLGYAEGNNVGIKFALARGSDFVLLLNNDTIVDPGILKGFIAAADDHADAGIFGAKIYYHTEPTKIWFTAGRLDTKAGKFIHLGEDYVDIEQKYGETKEADFVCGCALFFRRVVAETIGLLNPKYFLLFEETDWCYRARKSGFRVLYVPEAKIWHKVSASFKGEVSPLYNYFFTRNRLLWAQQNLSKSQRRSVYLAVIKEFFKNSYGLDKPFFIKRLYWDVVSMIRNYRKPEFRAKIFGIRDFIFRRFGNCPDGVKRMQKTIAPQESICL